jgi:hypothetical protein
MVSEEPQIIDLHVNVGGHYFITTHFYENLAECKILMTGLTVSAFTRRI